MRVLNMKCVLVLWHVVEDGTVESENILTTYVVTQKKLTQFDRPVR